MAENDWDENTRLRNALISMVEQYAYWSNGGLTTGGMAAQEEAFEVLGWTDPHPAPHVCCDEPGCLEQAACGWPTKTGYRRTCPLHYEGTPHAERAAQAVDEVVEPRVMLNIAGVRVRVIPPSERTQRPEGSTDADPTR